jgi:hypothetical protein
MKRAHVALFALVALLAPALRAADAPAPAGGEIIELPKFVVTDSRELPPPESWRYATIPGFEILSNASDRATKRLIEDFEMFTTALGYVWPINTKPTAPTALLICGRGAKFDAFIPAKSDGGPETSRASLFLKANGHAAIVLDFESKVLSVLSAEGDDPASGEDSSQISVDHNKQLYREYVHFLMSQAEPRVPAWLEEGMAQIIMAMKFDRKSIIFGQLEDPNTVSIEAAFVAQTNAATAADDPTGFTMPGAPAEDRDFNVALARKALVPMDKFFAVTHDSPEALNPLGNNRWAKQAYAFVHMCLYGENGKWQKSFAQFVTRLAKEPPSEALFKECFKMSYSSMATQLRSYVEFTPYTHKEYYAKKGDTGLPQPPPLALREATQSEVGRLKGETLLLGGHRDAARRELIAPYVRGERDPRLLASLGLFEHGGGQDDRARKFLEAAVAAKVDEPDAYVELARMRYADAVAHPADAAGNFSTEQRLGIVNLLLGARRLPPPLSGTYELYGDTWGHAATKPTKDDAALLVEGARLFPGRLKLVYQASALCADAGLIEAAYSLVDYGIKVAPDPSARARFEKLKTLFPPEPPAAAKQPAAEPAKK